MFILEGNIGAGKTTLLNKIQASQHQSSFPDIEVVFEPVNSWHKQEAGQSLLGNFYADIPRWAYTLETYAMACRVKEHIAEQEKNNPYKLIERSIYSGHYCFAHNSFRSGGMTSIEWQVYTAWYDFLLRNKCRTPHGFIYLKSDPEICLERIKKRNRAGESNISLDYLCNINRAHDDFLLDKKDVSADLKEVPVLILDGNQSFDRDESLFAKYHSCISTFMHDICQTRAQTNSWQQNVCL